MVMILTGSPAVARVQQILHHLHEVILTKSCGQVVLLHIQWNP